MSYHAIKGGGAQVLIEGGGTKVYFLILCENIFANGEAGLIAPVWIAPPPPINCVRPAAMYNKLQRRQMSRTDQEINKVSVILQHICKQDQKYNFVQKVFINKETTRHFRVERSAGWSLIIYIYLYLFIIYPK